jgi:hypothetical protein
MIKNNLFSAFLFITILAVLPIKAQKSSPIYADEFSKATVGNFPANWESNVRGEIVTVKNEPGKWLKMHAGGTYIPTLSQNLPGNFTIDFDFIYEALGENYNTTEITIYSKKPGEAYDVAFPGNNGLKIFLENFIVSCASYNQQKMDDKLAREQRTHIIQASKKVKVSIHISNGELNIIINNKQILTAPVANTATPFNALRFHLWGSQAEPLISNLKITSK